MALVTTVESGVINNVSVMPRLEVLVSDQVPNSLLFLDPLLFTAPMSTSPLLTYIASLTSIRETLPLALPIVSTTAFKPITATALLVTIVVISVLDVSLTFAPPLTTARVDNELDFDPDVYLDGDF